MKSLGMKTLLLRSAIFRTRHESHYLSFYKKQCQIIIFDKIKQFHFKADDSFKPTYGDFHVQIIRDKDEIRKGQRLLYERYIELGKWKWIDENPTGFQIKEEKGWKYLADDFDNRAVWIGSFYKKYHLMGILRLLPKVDDDSLDMTRYKFTKLPKLREFFQKPNLIEVQRLALDVKFEGKQFCLLNLMYAFKICYESKGYMLHTPSGKPPLVKYHYGNVLYDAADYGDNVKCNLVVWKPRECLAMYNILDEKVKKIML